MILRIALRSIFRNSRRSLITLLTIAVGVSAMLVFAGYALYDVYVLQTTTVQRGGHLTIYRKGYFDFGSGDPAIWGIDRYREIIDLIESDQSLKSLTAVITPVQFLGGIAENPDTGGSRTFFATGFVPTDQAHMQQWDEYGIGTALENTGLRTTNPTQGVIGLGFARYLGLCEKLHLAACPHLPSTAPAREGTDIADLPKQDFSALSESQVTRDPTAQVNLMAATATGAPNIVRMEIERVERQGAREMDDGYVVMNLALAQQLVYGRGAHKVTGIVLQLHRSEDVPVARGRLNALFSAHRLDLEARDFREINAFYGQTLNFFNSMFAFIAVLIGVVVLFTVSNIMSMNVFERVDEIGTTRALGARRGRIRSQFLIEGSLLGFLGATLGVGAAFLAAFAINHAGLTWTPPGDVHPIPLRLYLVGATGTIAITWLILTLVATIAALQPANRAARLPIVDALRHV